MNYFQDFQALGSRVRLPGLVASRALHCLREFDDARRSYLMKPGRVGGEVLLGHLTKPQREWWLYDCVAHNRPRQ